MDVFIECFIPLCAAGNITLPIAMTTCKYMDSMVDDRVLLTVTECVCNRFAFKVTEL